MKITAKISQNGNLVRIDDFEFEGYISHFLCIACGSEQAYYKKYDAFFCPRCNFWLEDKCSDPNCQHCASRPETPLPNN
jgi:hypothetical protein